MTGPAAQPGDPPQTTQPAATRPEELAGMLGQMAGVVLSRETVDTALELVTTLAAATNPSTAGAAVTVVDEHGKRTLAATDQVAEQADALQYELDEGPCLTAWRSQRPVRIDDTGTDPRWPTWTAAALRLGVRSTLSTPLLVDAEAIGAIKIYSTRPGNYDEHAEQVLVLFAHQAAILLANVQSLASARQLSRQLTDALDSRDAISQATGVLLARGAADRQTAFTLLADAARQSGSTVEQVARALLATVTTRDTEPPTTGQPGT